MKIEQVFNVCSVYSQRNYLTSADYSNAYQSRSYPLNSATNQHLFLGGVYMSDRLIVPIVKPLTPKEGNTIRAVVDNDTLKELNEISDKTGIYISQLARMCIEFALPRIEIQEGVKVEKVK